MDKKFNFYKEHPKTCSPDDFWRQVKRTVNGQPVSEEQINMIVHSIVANLELGLKDHLLDLCCGNGALTTRVLKYCASGLGVDFSEYLIEVAKENFEIPKVQTYLLKDVVDFCEQPTSPETFTKMLCYGSFSYIEAEYAERLLLLLSQNFRNLERVFIGNCPDRNKASIFFGHQDFDITGLRNPESAIGIWRTEEEFVELAYRTGWSTEIHKMPKEYYASHYRYDAILTRL